MIGGVEATTRSLSASAMMQTFVQTSAWVFIGQVDIDAVFVREEDVMAELDEAAQLRLRCA